MQNVEKQQTLKLIKTHFRELTTQQFKTLKGQCLVGDVEGAKKGLYKILNSKNKE